MEKKAIYLLLFTLLKTGRTFFRLFSIGSSLFLSLFAIFFSLVASYGADMSRYSIDSKDDSRVMLWLKVKAGVRRRADTRGGPI